MTVERGLAIWFNQGKEQQFVGAVVKAEFEAAPVLADQHIVEIAGKEVGEIETRDARAEADQAACARGLTRQAGAPARNCPEAEARQHRCDQGAGIERPIGRLYEGPADRYGKAGKCRGDVDDGDPAELHAAVEQGEVLGAQAESQNLQPHRGHQRTDPRIAVEDGDQRRRRGQQDRKRSADGHIDPEEVVDLFVGDHIFLNRGLVQAQILTQGDEGQDRRAHRDDAEVLERQQAGQDDHRDELRRHLEGLRQSGCRGALPDRLAERTLRWVECAGF
jgi:ribosomal protein L16/L10AE